MDKGDPKKHYSYESIESKIALNRMYDFAKKPKKNYSIANTDMSQLDFPVNEMMFIMGQYKIVEKFDN